MTGGGLLLTISEHIMIGETISHDAKAILRGVRHPFIWNNDLKLLGLAGSMKEAYEIVLKLVQMGYNSDCIYEMNDYLEKF